MSDRRVEVVRDVPGALDQPPMITVGEQGGRIFAVGLGIGATHEAKATISPIRAAGRFMINTVIEPFAIMPGPPGTQRTSRQGSVMLVTMAAWRLLIITVGTHERRI